jgi:ADP-dependent NAD(P)H-hydrate dehydratase / NAD(P)H-hydrate epimerase
MKPEEEKMIVGRSFIASHLKKREAASNKSHHGHALLIAGSRGKMGAAVIAAGSCIRTGTGLLTINIPSEERSILQTAVPEAMVMMREEGGDLQKFSAIGVGPGMGTGEDAVALLTNLLQQSAMPMVLDADAITILANHPSLFETLPEGCILTPHSGEFDRLFGVHNSEEERRDRAVQLSIDQSLVIVSKGPHTQTASKGKAYINTTGNAGLAKGGSGDALTGMILSLLAQGYTALHAAVTGVYLHGLAADIALESESVESLVATDLLKCIGKAFNISRG